MKLHIEPVLNEKTTMSSLLRFEIVLLGEVKLRKKQAPISYTLAWRRNVTRRTYACESFSFHIPKVPRIVMYRSRLSMHLAISCAVAAVVRAWRLT